jgi:TPP-dependent pyruvate/acetoin dehydrogenase alpha subunit
MAGLTYSAIGTERWQGLNYHKLNPSTIRPGLLMSGDDGPMPSDEVVKSEASTTVAKQLRTSLLDQMGLSENDVKQMRADTRSDLEQHIAKRVHEEILASPNPQPGSLVDVKA